MATAVGIIGGTGLYGLEGLEELEERVVDTPFGPTSSNIHSGKLDGVQLHFIARHGEGHTLLPSEVKYRANIYALKALGVQWCLSVSAVGSLQEEFAPGDVVIPDQIIDRTSGRDSTFFGNGIVAHIPFATPYCPVFSELLNQIASEVARDKKAKAHLGGTYLCMEGPAFSTRAESHLYRSGGASIIGMTGIPEAKLAREAELAYATLALVTDYDCWRSAEADVDIHDILATMSKNVELAKEIIVKVVPRIRESDPSELAASALAQAIVTDPKKIPRKVREDLGPIIGKHLRY